MRKLCFGGSFNPVHKAHLTCSAAAAGAAGFTHVTLIPSRDPPLKTASYELAPADHRLAMLQLAASERDPRASTIFEVDDIELRPSGPRYTIDTVEALKQRGLDAVHWLIGADQLLNLPRWHRFEELMHAASFWVIARPGYVIDWGQVHPAARELSGRVVLAPAMDISATDIRRRVRAGEPIDDHVSPKVREYILTHRLYIP
jgi:nicotinate-nucleotide adenylyltransferase